MIKPLKNSLNKFIEEIFFKKQYLKNLKHQLTILDNLNQKNYKLISKSILSINPEKYVKDNIVMYIVDIKFSKSNIFFHITDSAGKLKFFSSAGHFAYKGKQKKKYYIVLKSMYQLLKKPKLKFLTGKPVALHLKNTGFKSRSIIKKLQTKLFIKTIKIFNAFPFNGCRKQKIRRKKSRKIRAIIRRNG